MAAPRYRILAAYLGNELDERLVLDGLPVDGLVTAHVGRSSAPGEPALHHLLRCRCERTPGGVRVTLSARDLQRGVAAAELRPGLYYLVVQVPGRYHAAARLRLHAARVV